MIKNIGIIGAGITGLSCGYFLSRYGFKVDIFESEKTIGGLAKSLKIDGFVFDIGPHAFYTKNEDVFNEVKSLLGNDLICVGPMYNSIKIIFGGKEYIYPLKILSVLMNFPLKVNLKALSDFMKAYIRRKTSSQEYKTFEDWVSQHFGQTLYELFFKSYTMKTWGIDPRNLAASFASERIPTLKIRDMIKNTFKKSISMSEITGKITEEGELNCKYSRDHSYYPGESFGQICKRLEEGIISNNGTSYKGYKLDSIKSDSHTLIFRDEENKIFQRQYDYIISTIPITDFVRAFTHLPDEIVRVCDNLRFRDISLVLLMVKKPFVFDCRLVYFHDSNIIFQRVSEIKHLSKYTTPGPDYTSLCLEITKRGLVSNDELIEKSIADLVSLKILKPDDILDAKVIDAQNAYPIYTVDYKKDLEALEAFLSAKRNIISVGRQGMFRYLDADLCFFIGMKTSQALQNGKELNLNTLFSQWATDAKV